MTGVVLDASVLVEYLRWSPSGSRIGARLIEESLDLHLPYLAGVEVASVFRALVLRGEVEPARAESALADLVDLPAARYPAEPLLPRIWELREKLTAYDANYVALAEALEAPLFTMDRRMARSRGHGAHIDVLD